MGYRNPSGVVVGIGAGLLFIVIVAVVIPHQYNANLQSARTHASFCSNLKNVLDNADGSRPDNVTIAYLNQYSAQCSR